MNLKIGSIFLPMFRFSHAEPAKELESVLPVVAAATVFVPPAEVPATYTTLIRFWAKALHLVVLVWVQNFYRANSATRPVFACTAGEPATAKLTRIKMPALFSLRIKG
jgi:hypothetical protein